MSAKAQCPRVAQEDDDVPWGRVVVAFVAMLAISAIFIAWSVRMLINTRAEFRPSGTPTERHLTFRRRVSRVEEDLFEWPGLGLTWNAEAKRDLARFHWVDKSTVSIPIALALEIYLREHQP